MQQGFHNERQEKNIGEVKDMIESFGLFWDGLTNGQAFVLCVVAAMIVLTIIDIAVIVIKHNRV